MATVISTRMPEASDKQQRATSDLTAIEKELVRRFFTRINTIWGVALYRAQYPDSDMERLAMREWAFDIINYSHQELEERLTYAKEQMAVDPEWRYPNIAMILKGRPAAPRLSAMHRTPSRESCVKLKDMSRYDFPGRETKYIDHAKPKAIEADVFEDTEAMDAIGKKLMSQVKI